MTFENMISEVEIIQSIGLQIRKLREEKNLSQQNLADLCNVPKSTIARIERAEVNVKFITLVKIANALEMDLIKFFNYLLLQTVKN